MLWRPQPFRGVVDMRAPALVFVAVLLAACSSDKTAAPGLQVALTGPATVQGFQSTDDTGRVVYRCDFMITATATGGSPGDVATWTGGHFTFFHQNGTTASSAIAVANEEGLLGGNTGLPSGTSASGNDSFYTGSDAPFHLNVVFYFSTPHTTTDSAVYNMACQ
jgi:hypothetical protein